MPRTRIPWAPSRGDAYQVNTEIPRLMLEIGRQRAEGYQRGGDIWSRTLGDIGAGIGGYLADAPKRRKMAQEEQDRAADIDYRREQTAGLRRKATTEAAVGEAVGGYGQEGFDISAAVQRLPPEARPGAFKLYNDLETSRLQSKKLKDEAAEHDSYAIAKGAHAAESLLDSPIGEIGTGMILSYFKQHFPKEVGGVEQKIQQDPASLRPLLKSLQGGSPKFQKELLDQEKTRAETDKLRQPDKPVPPRVVGRELVSDDGKVIYRSPREESEATRPVAILGDDGKPLYVKPSDAVGKQPAPSTQAKETTEDERKTAGFYSQMRDSIKIIDELESQLSEKELYQIQTLPQEALVGLANRNSLSEAAKRYLRAFEQFTESRLRPVSGAAIADSEYARDRRTYARQYGETTKLAEDRKRARISALGTLKTRAGRALPKDEDEGWTMVGGLRVREKK